MVAILTIEPPCEDLDWASTTTSSKLRRSSFKAIVKLGPEILAFTLCVIYPIELT